MWHRFRQSCSFAWLCVVIWWTPFTKCIIQNVQWNATNNQQSTKPSLKIHTIPLTIMHYRIMHLNKCTTNHPPNIIKQLPKPIEQRLSNNSFNATIFNEAVTLYKKSVFRIRLQCQNKLQSKQETKQKSRNRKRNIISFNPPYNKNVVTKVGYAF